MFLLYNSSLKYKIFCFIINFVLYSLHFFSSPNCVLFGFNFNNFLEDRGDYIHQQHPRLPRQFCHNDFNSWIHVLHGRISNSKRLHLLSESRFRWWVLRVVLWFYVHFIFLNNSLSSVILKKYCLSQILAPGAFFIHSQHALIFLQIWVLWIKFWILKSASLSFMTILLSLSIVKPRIHRSGNRSAMLWTFMV